MTTQKFFARTAVLAATTVLVTGAASISKSWAEPQPSPKQLVDEVWHILDQNYVDGSFNQQDWKAVRQDYLGRNYSSREQAYKAIQQMVSKLGDRYTEFFEPQAYNALNTEISGNLSGVGLELAADEKTKALTVVAPIEQSPAAAAGILPADVVTKINGRSTQGMNINDAVKQIKGEAGTQVVLTILRGHQNLTFKLTRANITLNPVSYRTQTTDFGKIGYIRLPEFTQTAPTEMSRAIVALEKQNVQGYVLDLRSDPGGLLDASLKIASMWMEQTPIVSLVNRQAVKERYETEGRSLTQKPLVVLVDGGSASASEILAGALQDDGRAVLVGTRTFGKGLVQAVQPLGDGSAIKLTIAKYYTPKGRDINHVGITPDVVVGLTDAQKKALVQKRQVATTADPQYATALVSLGQLIQTKAAAPTQTGTPVRAVLR
ncbi:MAG: PDZ domain-containing protein [Stenomitos rutilans HA7619-LM2]|jgi:carboxyl-terminal processing protease|nr:PDZ domain-containing protein [Stenomitos rutilans HA7619-LM2]